MFCSSMLCVVCDNFSIFIVDADTRRVVRTFHGHTNRITDVVRITMHFIILHVQRERGKVIGRGVHIYIYIYIYLCL